MLHLIKQQKLNAEICVKPEAFQCLGWLSQSTGLNENSDCITKVSIWNGRESSQEGISVKQNTEYPYAWWNGAESVA